MATSDIKENEMKLTNRQLRKAIRRVIVESLSSQEADMLSRMFASGNIEHTRQAILLAESLDEITILEYKKRKTSEYYVLQFGPSISGIFNSHVRNTPNNHRIQWSWNNALGGWNLVLLY